MHYTRHTFGDMALPVKAKKETRPVSISFRVSARAASNLKTLAKEHNLSQADVIEHLILAEYVRYERKKR